MFRSPSNTVLGSMGSYNAATSVVVGAVVYPVNVAATLYVPAVGASQRRTAFSLAGPGCPESFLAGTVVPGVGVMSAAVALLRSEERRVGKECRQRREPDD